MAITKKHIFSLFILVIVGLAVFVSSPVFADESLLGGQIGLNTVGQKAYGNERPQDIRIIIVKAINVVLSFLGIIFFGLVVFAGFQYMTSAGNEEKAKKATGLLSNAIIGLIIILASWAISRYVLVVMNNTVSNKVDYMFYSPY
ncbi:MAG: hypothetical protein WC146_01210 [Patescibacteria group bacterium]|jgi:hypothetical protein